MVKVSIIIPVYKTEAYLKECLDSVLAQDFQDWEAICVNDGSPDNSLQILNEYASKDSRFHVISTENQGLSVARNTALKHSTGEWIMFLDSDDLIDPKTLSTFLEVAEKTQQPVVASSVLGDPDTPPKDIQPTFCICTPAFTQFVNNPKIYSSACSKLYRRDILQSISFIPGIYFEDWPFVTLLFSKINSFALISEPLYLYRQTPNSTVRSAFSKHKIDSYMTGIQFVNEQLASTPYIKLAKKRCSFAMRMCINKVWRDKERRNELVPYLIQQTQLAHKKGYFSWKYISIKTIMRYQIMKYQYK